MNNLSGINNVNNTIPKIKVLDGVEMDCLNVYDFIEGLWISNVAVCERNGLKQLITNSNHFIDTGDIGQETGHFTRGITGACKAHHIYSRMIVNYNKLLYNNQSVEVIPNKCVFLHNSFSTGNAGHDLFCMLNTLDKFKNSKDMFFVLFNEVNLHSNNYKILKLFVPNNKIIKIHQNKIYRFKRRVFNYEIGCHHVTHYHSIINILLDKKKIKHDKELNNDKKTKFKNRKIILIKNTNQNSIVRPEDCFNANLLFKHLRNENWIIINPEKMDFLKLTYLLMNAQVIITGQRGISCCNQIFYNLNARIIGFLETKTNNSLQFVNKTTIKHDVMCNAYYYHNMNEVILSPLNITSRNVEEFKRLNI